MKGEGLKKIRRALISVSDKSNLIPFVQGLRRFQMEVISTGGTAKLLKENSIPVREVAEFTGFPEILGGRVKTLHPKVHGGILLKREDKRHLAQAKELGIEPIDLVVVNLYPFEKAAQRRRVPLGELIEEIDIGGVTLMRSAAKNFASVAVVSSPSQYPLLLKELEEHGGKLSLGTRFQLAVETFSETAYIDGIIHATLAHRSPHPRPLPSGEREKGEGRWPQRFVLAAFKKQTLRYGENPHQAGVWYATGRGSGSGGLAQAQQLHGKELSFNNLLDLDAALQIVAAFDKPCVAVVKHMNPCGVACARNLAAAFRGAFQCDPLSAFGGIVGFNRPVDRAAASAILESGFLECLIAPGFSKGALEILRAKKNLRVVQVPPWKWGKTFSCLDIKQISGGVLLQEPDRFQKKPGQWRQATTTRTTPSQRRDLEFAWKVCRFARSNAIVIAKDEKTLGLGAGQMSRVDSVQAALRKAGKRAKGAVLASDGFFPKPDGPRFAVKAGIRAIVQPGGSIQDPEVVKVAQKARVPMLLTGERHFRH